MADRNEGTRFEANPIERVRDLIEANRNHFGALDVAAETLRDELDVPAHELFRALSERLRARHGILVRVLPIEVMRDTLRRFDRHRRHLVISELVDMPGRAFQTAFQLALIEAGAAIDETIARGEEQGDGVRRLLRISLANYFAGAVMMPYSRFHEAAESLAYDVEQFGIQVLLIEPGPYVTDIWQTSPRFAPSGSVYRRWSENVFRSGDAHVADKGGDPQVVAEKIANVLEAKRPSFRNPVGRLARYTHFARGKIPSRWLRRGVEAYLGLRRVRL